MKLLLDTHIWLWSLQDPARLGRRVQQELRNTQNELWLSPISTWEALVLNHKGKIHLKADPADWLSRATSRMREAPLTHEIALVARQFPWTNQDPADRFLAATAKVLDLTLVTADQNLLSLPDISVLPNR